MTKPNSNLFQRLTRRLVVGVPAMALVLLNLVTVIGHAAAVKAHEGKIVIPTYPWSAVKHPLLPRHGRTQHLSLPDAGQPQPH